MSTRWRVAPAPSRAPSNATETRAERAARAHLNLRSVRFRNALRAAVGLAAAMLLAKTLDVQHGFWVVLGTLTVLRSTALGTRRTATLAVAGSVVGFALATALIVLVGGNTVALWIAFPVLVFLATYTPEAVNFVVGQACFTVLVVDLFNLVVPDGWRTGLVRLQDVALGALVSLVVGFVLWPRGAGGVVRATFDDLAAADAQLFDDAIGRLAGPSGPSGSELDVEGARRARDRALVALETLATEQGVEQAEREPWLSALAISTATQRAAEGIERDVDDSSYAPECTDLRDTIVREARRLQHKLAGPIMAQTTEPSVSVAPRTEALTDALVRCASANDEAPVGLLWARAWIVSLESARVGQS